MSTVKFQIWLGMVIAFGLIGCSKFESAEVSIQKSQMPGGSLDLTVGPSPVPFPTPPPAPTVNPSLDLSKARWEILNPPWTRTRVFHSAVVHNGRMISFGAMADNDVFDLTTRTWSMSPSVSAPAEVPGGFAMAQIAGSAYIFGGYINSTVVTDRFFRLDLDTFTWTALPKLGEAPGTNRWSPGVWTGERFLTFGGYTQRTDEMFDYNPVNAQWSKRTTNLIEMSTNRVAYTAVWTGSKILVFGGAVGNKASHALWQFDPSTLVWSEIVPNGVVPPGRSWASAVWTGDKMIIYGGKNYPESNLVYGDCWVYDSKLNTWTELQIPGGPGPRSGHSAVWTGSEMIIYGGLDPNVPSVLAASLKF